MKSKPSLYVTVNYPYMCLQDRLDDTIDKYANTSKKVFVLDELYDHVNDNLYRTIYQGVLTNIDEFINGTTI